MALRSARDKRRAASENIVRKIGPAIAALLSLSSAAKQFASHEVDAMTPEEALRNILKLVEGSDELEDAHAMQILLQSIKTLAEKGLGCSN
jgi:hypothetical protein